MSSSHAAKKDSLTHPPEAVRRSIIISENWNQRKRFQSTYLLLIIEWWRLWDQWTQLNESCTIGKWRQEGHGSANSTLSLNENDSVPTQPYVRFTASREHNYFTTPLTILYTFISHAYLVSKLFHQNFTTSSNCKCKPIPILNFTMTQT